MTLDSLADFVAALQRYQLLEPGQLAEARRIVPTGPDGPKALARELLQRGWLTPFQANQLLQGKGGDLVLGSYLLLQRLGEGGMGQVFKARHHTLGRVVALKVIRKERLANADAVKRFRREIRAAAQLNHPNIVLAFDADEANGAHFFTMEFVEGTDLERLVHQQGPLAVAQACDCIRQAALGLQHAHERGLVHRDIKPANLLLTSQGGVVKVLDMGLARHDAGAGGDGSSTLTQVGMVMGTPDFLAPEQALRSHDVDIRADLYSLGCTFYFLLTGRLPFPGGTLTDKLLRHQLEEPDPLASLRPEVTPEVTAVVRKLMAKKPEQRYQIPAELAASLASGGRQPPENSVPRGANAPRSPGNGDTVVARVAGRQQRLRTERRRRLWLNVAGGGTLLLVLGLLFLLLRGTPALGPSTAAGARSGESTLPQTNAAALLQRWQARVAAMSAEEQVVAVAKKLQEVNPEFDGRVKPGIQNGVVTELSFTADNVTDLSPVRALTWLTVLNVTGSGPGKGRLANLGPLQGLKLTTLSCYCTEVADLRPLQGMELTSLYCSQTKVTDLGPLQDLPLTMLDCHNTAVTDLRPLRGMKSLVSLNLESTPVSDLGPLNGLQLRSLNCSNARVTDLRPLQGLPLKHLSCFRNSIVDLGPLRDLKSLADLACGSTSVSDLGPLAGLTNLSSLNCSGTKVTDLTPVRGLKLTNLDCSMTGIGDLAPLEGMPMTNLQVGRTPVASLAPLQGMRLTVLNLCDTKVTEIGVLEGMPLIDLRFSNAPVANLMPLSGMKQLTTLYCDGTKAADLEPLRNLPLRTLGCTLRTAGDAAILKGIPTLQVINRQQAAAFWKQVDAMPPMQP